MWSTKLRSQNRLVPAGKIGGAPAPEGQEYTFTVQLQGRLTSTQEFENIILRTTDAGGLVRLKDVGRVELGGETYGIDAIDLKGCFFCRLAIYQLSGSNAIEVSNGVKDVLAEFEQTLPVGLGVQKIYDTTDFINQSIKGVTNSLRDAVILVVLILFLFLQNWKATLVPAIAIPVALIGTFALVLAFGFSLNQLTLFGLVLATGLVVDDAITVVEDTSAKKAEGMTSVQAAMETMDELFGAVIATSLVKMAVFLPVLFFPGATGTIYKQFAATILFSIGISTFNALTFSPMLSALLLSKETKELSRQSVRHGRCGAGFHIRPAECWQWLRSRHRPNGDRCGDRLHRRQDHRYALASSLHRRWSCGGCDHHWCDLLQSDSGGSVHRDRSWRWLLHPGDLHQLQPFLWRFRAALCIDPRCSAESPSDCDGGFGCGNPADGICLHPNSRRLCAD